MASKTPSAPIVAAQRMSLLLCRSAFTDRELMWGLDQRLVSKWSDRRRGRGGAGSFCARHERHPILPPPHAVRTRIEAAARALRRADRRRARRRSTADEAVAAADELGFPVVAKLSGDAIAHKTERGLVRLGLADADAVARGRDRAARGGARRTTATSRVLVAPMVRGNRELIAGLVPRPAVRPDRDARRRRHPRRGARRRRLPRRRRSTRRRRRASMIDDARHAARCSATFRGEPAVDRDALAAVLVGPRPARGRAPRRRERRPQPADRRRRRAGRRRRARGARRGTARVDRARRARRRPPSTSAPLFEPRGVLVAGASTPPRQVRLRLAAQPPRLRLRGRACSAPNREGEEVLGIQTVARHRRAARRRGRPRVRVHARPRPTPTAARLRGEGHPGRVPHLAPATARPATRAGARRGASWSRSPTSSASCSPARTARAWSRTPVAPVRADRRAVPAGRAASASPARAATSSRPS